MARTLKEIQNSIKTEFVQNPTLRQAYGLDTDKEFDQQFSKVSVEALLIYVVATVIWAHENLWDRFAQEIEEKVNSSQVMTTAWYYHMAKKFQYGETLVFNQERYTYEYPQEKPEKQIAKYVAVRENIEVNNVTKLRIYVSKEKEEINKNGTKEIRRMALEEDEIDQFKHYMERIGAAGIHYDFINKDPDPIAFLLVIYYDPMVLNSRGESIADGSSPVIEAIKDYLNHIEHGGLFYSSQLTDALQKVPGVKDVVLEGVRWGDDYAQAEYLPLRRIDSISGSFVFDENTTNEIIYSLDVANNEI